MNKKNKAGSTAVHIRPCNYQVFARRTRKIKDHYKVNTRSIREDSIKKLKELADKAQKWAISKYIPTETRQKWAKITAYVYQTLNAVTNSYDQVYIIEKMEELTERVEEFMEEDEGS